MVMELRFPCWENLKEAQAYARGLNDNQNRYYAKGKRIHYVVRKGKVLNLDWLMAEDETSKKLEPEYLTSYMVVIE